jgi:Mg2+ and Co2+ transporter CorA
VAGHVPADRRRSRRDRRGISPRSSRNLAAIVEELSLHWLAVEDAVREHQRPKLDRYDTYAVRTAAAVRLDDTTGVLARCEVAAVVGLTSCRLWPESAYVFVRPAASATFVEARISPDGYNQIER